MEPVRMHWNQFGCIGTSLDALMLVRMHLKQFGFIESGLDAWEAVQLLVLPDWWRGKDIVTAPTTIPGGVTLKTRRSEQKRLYRSVT